MLYTTYVPFFSKYLPGKTGLISLEAMERESLGLSALSACFGVDFHQKVRFKANTAERGVPGISDLLFSSGGSLDVLWLANTVNDNHTVCKHIIGML